jgi:hypothetical protein
MPISGKPEIGAGVSKDEETVTRRPTHVSNPFFPPQSCDAMKM